LWYKNRKDTKVIDEARTLPYLRVGVKTVDYRFTRGSPVEISSYDGVIYIRDSHEPKEWTKNIVSNSINQSPVIILGSKHETKPLLSSFEVDKKFYIENELIAFLPQQSFSFSLSEHCVEEEIRGVTCVFKTVKGLFSYTHIDDATRFLLETVRLRGDETILDFGCGYGAISCFLSVLYKDVTVLGVDSNMYAVSYATKNTILNGVSNNVTVKQSYLLQDISSPVDVVICNPPTHISLDEVRMVFNQMFKMLSPGGSVYMVINRAVGYESILRDVFGVVECIDTRDSFKILRSHKR